MSYTKRQFIDAAFTELGMSSHSFELLPDQYSDALVRLDSMLAEWNARGIRIGYNVPSTPGSSTLDDDSYLPDKAWEAVITNLALRLAPSYGKTVSIDTRVAARHALNTLLVDAAMPVEQQLATIPAGAGYKYLDRVFFEPDESSLVIGNNTELDLD